jgi:hypothetical protein
LRVPDGCLTPGQTGRLTVGRNITLTLTWQPLCGGGSNAFTVALLVVRGRKGNCGYNLGKPVSVGYKYMDLALQLWVVSNLRQKNIVVRSAGFGPDNDCVGNDKHQFKTTYPFSRQRGRPILSNQQMYDNIKNRIRAPDGSWRQDTLADLPSVVT